MWGYILINSAVLFATKMGQNICFMWHRTGCLPQVAEHIIGNIRKLFSKGGVAIAHPVQTLWEAKCAQMHFVSLGRIWNNNSQGGL